MTADNSPEAIALRLKRHHRRVLRCPWCRRVLRRWVWVGIGPPSHAQGAWRLWRPMQDGEPCIRERWDERRRSQAWRKRTRKLRRARERQYYTKRFVYLALERARSAGAIIPDGLPEEPRYLHPGRYDRRLPL